MERLTNMEAHPTHFFCRRCNNYLLFEWPAPRCFCYHSLGVGNFPTCISAVNQPQFVNTQPNVKKTYRSVESETDECIMARRKEIGTQTEQNYEEHYENKTKVVRKRQMLTRVETEKAECSRGRQCSTTECQNNSVCVRKSKINNNGLFCLKSFGYNECIIELTGEVIENEVADEREKFYESKGIGCYMHRLNAQLILDSTEVGNEAKFINHSCDPNCCTRIVKRSGRLCVFVYSLRKLMKGEEITTDYNFSIEECKIPCTCGSQKCRKYLN